ncbi:MAG TPA: glycine--tRNA ligase [bacterium]|nr:glycine--tRNA ligase [bacterium]HPL95184.1 glycine--tRNA ligase [bacterium]
MKKTNRTSLEADKMDKLISLAKRRGFIFQSSEIYGGFGAYDYGPLGVELKNNIKRAWWRMFVTERPDMFGVDAAIIMHPRVWEASGHLKNFSDALVDCKKCHKRFRADHVLELENLKPGFDKEKNKEPEKMICPECGGELTAARQFNLMFKTFIGPVEEEGSVSYLRPETAGGIFTNYKNILQATRTKIPFGIAQIGKAFRNEITTENYIFRTREFEQMEVEYFIHPKNWEKSFEQWQKLMEEWCAFLGIKKENLKLHEISDNDRAFYSKRTIDFEYEYPFGVKELYGLAYRTDYDLSQHQKFSGEDLTYTDPESNEKFLPHVIEPSLGVDRSVLVALLEAYSEVAARSGEDDAKHETEVVLKLPYELAPIKVAILPLSKKEPLINLAKEIENDLRKTGLMIQYDETGSIGKRYRRQDEIGTPFCVTVDFDSLEDKKVTVRDRDTMQQERIAIEDLGECLENKLRS